MEWVSTKGQILQIAGALISAMIAIAMASYTVPWIIPFLLPCIALCLGFASGRWLWPTSKALNSATGKVTESPQMDLLESSFENADKVAGITYPRKLRVIIRNPNDFPVMVGRGGHWKNERLSAQSHGALKFEIEPAQGWQSGKWTDAEADEVLVPPGKAIRTWIGLPPDTSESQITALKSRAELLGRLFLPVWVEKVQATVDVK